MNRLTGTDLAYIANHRERIYREWATQIYFCFDSKQTGEKAFDILTRVFADSINYKNFGKDKRDFYLGFNSRQVADDVMKEIDDSIAAYLAVDPNQINYMSAEEADEAVEGGIFSGKSGNTTWYIIAGAAAVILLLLLWDRKKKK